MISRVCRAMERVFFSKFAALLVYFCPVGQVDWAELTVQPLNCDYF